ncbi:MAG TPA: hypothetical protein VMS93_05715, partial [Candidatus Saccharimonadales bacterium]|nr:hypothetical protein [Candidatus Saccharimonadales bacterium]
EAPPAGAAPGAGVEARLAQLQRGVAEHLAEVLGLPPGFTRDELVAALGRREATAEEQAAVLAELDRQDRARFAPGSLGPEERAALAAGAEQLLGLLRQLRRRGWGRRK